MIKNILLLIGITYEQFEIQCIGDLKTLGNKIVYQYNNKLSADIQEKVDSFYITGKLTESNENRTIYVFACKKL
jgi:hypothetical protein